MPNCRTNIRILVLLTKNADRTYTVIESFITHVLSQQRHSSLADSSTMRCHFSEQLKISSAPKQSHTNINIIDVLIIY